MKVINIINARYLVIVGQIVFTCLKLRWSGKYSCFLGRLVTGLVKEFLEFFGLEYSLAVFDPESNFVSILLYDINATVSNFKKGNIHITMHVST